MVAAAVFTLAPYRIEHVMHLEMQWAMWIPLVFWSLTLTVEKQSWRFGALSGLLLWLQTLSCVYYGIFLAVTVLVFVPLLLIRARGGRSLRYLLSCWPRDARSRSPCRTRCRISTMPARSATVP